jgi:hypothetical protein
LPSLGHYISIPLLDGFELTGDLGSEDIGRHAIVDPIQSMSRSVGMDCTSHALQVAATNGDDPYSRTMKRRIRRRIRSASICAVVSSAGIESSKIFIESEYNNLVIRRRGVGCDNLWR